MGICIINCASHGLEVGKEEGFSFRYNIMARIGIQPGIY